MFTLHLFFLLEATLSRLYRLMIDYKAESVGHEEASQDSDVTDLRSLRSSAHEYSWRCRRESFLKRRY